MEAENYTFKMKSLKGTWGIVRCDLWHSTVVFYIGSRFDMKENAHEMIPKVNKGLSEEWEENTVDSICDWLHRHMSSSTSSTYGDAFCNGGNFFIRLDDFILGNLDDITYLSHECLHVANGILRHVGLREDDNIEGLCYTHEYIFSNILKQLMDAGDMPKLGTKEK